MPRIFLALSLQLCTTVSGIRLLQQEPSWPADYWDDDLNFVRGLVEGGSEEDSENPNTGLVDVLVYPLRKLAFCRIRKVASLNFNRLFASLNYNNISQSVVTYGDLPKVNAQAFGLDLADLTREKGWKWAVFLRNPLLRYLSAWGSKCFAQEGRGKHCIPHLLSSTGSVSDFEQHVLTSHMHPDLLIEGSNNHWRLQQDSCHGLRNATGYDFVGHLHGDVNGQVHAMLRMAGAPETHVHTAFPERGVAGHHTSLDPELYYRNRTIRKFVRDIYTKDYDLPGM